MFHGRAGPISSKAKIREEFDMEAAIMRLDPNTNNECLHPDLVELNPFLSRAEALSLFTQWIARPLVEESISDALSRAYTIVRASSLHRRD